jgi:hypothetical protein
MTWKERGGENLEGEGEERVIPLTAGDGVREVAGAILLSADVADTARIKGEHCRLGGRGEGGGGGAESLSLSQKKGRRRIGTCSQRRNFSVLIPLVLLRTTKGIPFRKVHVRFSRSFKTLFSLSPAGISLVRLRSFPSRPFEND